MEIFDVILHLDKYLASIISILDAWIYIVLFLVIFAETGLVVTPFLPGDSLLFAVGTLAGAGLLNVWIAYFTMLVAAIVGDAVNYFIGKRIGKNAFTKENPCFIKKEYLEKTRHFYEKYGAKTIVIARFMPIVRTFAPFVAGVVKMDYKVFALYNVVGAFIWTTSLTFAGFLLGGIYFVKDNFNYVVLAIIVLSLVPMIIEYIKYKTARE